MPYTVTINADGAQVYTCQLSNVAFKAIRHTREGLEIDLRKDGFQVVVKEAA